MAKERFQLLKKYLSPHSLDVLREIYSPIKYIRKSRDGVFLAQESKQLLLKQEKNGEFIRYDLIFIILAIKQH